MKKEREKILTEGCLNVRFTTFYDEVSGCKFYKIDFEYNGKIHTVISKSVLGVQSQAIGYLKCLKGLI